MLKQVTGVTAILLGIWFFPAQASQTLCLKHESVKRSQKALALIKKGTSSQNNFHRRTTLYLKARDLLQPGDCPIVHAQVLIGLGDTGYTDSFTKESYLWYIEAHHILKGSQCSDFALKIHLYKALARVGYTDMQHPKPSDWLLEGLALSNNNLDKLNLLLALEQYYMDKGNIQALQAAHTASQELLHSL